MQPSNFHTAHSVTAKLLKSAQNIINAAYVMHPTHPTNKQTMQLQFQEKHDINIAKIVNAVQCHS